MVLFGERVFLALVFGIFCDILLKSFDTFLGKTLLASL